MEKEGGETTSLGRRVEEERGAGGKLKKGPSRRPPATPYARPPQNQAHRSPWLSKLVDPARRIIAGGASLIIPSFFSKSQSVSSIPASPSSQGEDHDMGSSGPDKPHAEVEQTANGDNDNFSLNHLASRLTGIASTSRVADGLKSSSDSDGHEQHHNVDMSDHYGLPEIEQLMQEKRFSRDEVNHLIEIIRARAIDLPDIQQEKKNSSVVAGDIGRPAVALEYSGKVTEEKHEDLNRVIGGISTPLLQSMLQDDVGASPVDIARAYMENRTSEVGFVSKSLISKDEGKFPHGNEIALKPLIPSPSPKSSTCWPGAMVQDPRGYTTPQSHRGRFGMNNFPRTPYSRTIYSKSKSKLIQSNGINDKYLNVSPTPVQQSKTPKYGWVNSRGTALDDGHGSVGSILRMADKAAFLGSSLNGPSHVENLNVSGSFFSSVKENLEKGVTNSSSKIRSVDSKPQSEESRALGMSFFDNKPRGPEVSVPIVPTHSTQMARKILEHLERNPPTPKEKAAELRLATSWKKPQSSDATPILPNNHNSLPHLGAEKLDPFHKKNSVSWSEDRGNTLFKVPQVSATEGNVTAKDNTSASDIKDSTTVSSHDAGPSIDFSKSRMTMHKVVPNASGSDVLSLQKKPPSHSSANKPVLPYISIGKSEQRWTSSDNNLGFTFPVSTSAEVFSELPTPSIIPTSTASSLHQPNDGPSIPSYSFGSKRSTPSLVFSFPSTSSTPRHDDASDLNFTFGSDKTTRISFSSIGKDAICF